MLRERLGPALAEAVLLDVGASTGTIAASLAEHVRTVIGLDIDAHAIAAARERWARPNCAFRLGDAMHLDLADASVDVVLCAHVYEHVPDPQRMMREIARVLKPGGWCYFTAGNRLAIMEPHYRLPFLSIVPKWLAHRYLRLAGRGTHYYEEHLGWWGLRRLVADFRCVDYTRADCRAGALRYRLHDCATLVAPARGPRGHRLAALAVPGIRVAARQTR